MELLPQVHERETSPVKKLVIRKLYEYEEFFRYIPMEETLPDHPYDRVTSYPSVAFRKYNEDFPESVGVIQRDVEHLHDFGTNCDIDKTIADNYPGRRAKNVRLGIKSMAENAVFSFFYGNSPRTPGRYQAVDGFDGIQARLNPAGTQVIDGGASSGTDGSSVFALRFAEDGVMGLWTKQHFDARDLGELQTTKVSYRTRIDGTMGFAIYHGLSAGMITNINPSNPLTCAQLDKLLTRVKGASIICMSDTRWLELKANAESKGITLGQGVDSIGEVFDRWGKVPIIRPTAMLDDETNS